MTAAPLTPQDVLSSLFNKLARDNHGDFIPERARELTADQLEYWIDHRLSGYDPYVPIESGRGERIADAPVDLHNALREDIVFMQRMAVALTHLCQRRVVANRPINSPDEVFELFDIIERTRPDIDVSDLLRLAESRLLVGILSHQTDLHEKLLFVLAVLQRQLDPYFWQKEMEDPRFARAAFLGLCQMNPRAALGLLPFFVRQSHACGNDADVDYPLFYLIDYFGVSHALSLIRQALPADEHDSRLVIQEALARLGHPDVPLEQPEVLEAESAYGLEEPAAVGLCVYCEAGDLPVRRVSAEMASWRAIIVIAKRMFSKDGRQKLRRVMSMLGILIEDVTPASESNPSSDAVLGWLGEHGRGLADDMFRQMETYSQEDNLENSADPAEPPISWPLPNLKTPAD